MAEWWNKVRAVEPARVRAVWIALVALLASLGFTVNADVDGAVQGVLVAVFTLLPLLEGELIRRKVTPVQDPVDPFWLDDVELADGALVSEIVTAQDGEVADR